MIKINYTPSNELLNNIGGSISKDFHKLHNRESLELLVTIKENEICEYMDNENSGINITSYFSDGEILKLITGRLTVIRHGYLDRRNLEVLKYIVNQQNNIFVFNGYVNYSLFYINGAVCLDDDGKILNKGVYSLHSDAS